MRGKKEAKAKMYKGSYVVVVSRSRIASRRKRRHSYSTNTSFHHRLSSYFLRSITWCVCACIIPLLLLSDFCHQ